MSNIKTECETVGTRSKRRKLATEKDDTSLYKTSNAMSIRDKVMFDTPDESLSELEEFKSLPRSPAYSKKSGLNIKCDDDKSDNKIKINSNNKSRNKSKSPLNNEKTNVDHLPIQSIAEDEEYISKLKSKQKNITSRNSLSSTPQKEIVKNKNKKLSLDADVLNCKLDKLSNSPEFKFGKIKISSKEDISHKSNNKKNNTNFNCKNINEIEDNIRTRSKTRMNATPNYENSSFAEIPENKIQSSSEECSFNEPDFENSLVKANKIMEAISPIKANVKTTKTFEANSELEEEFSESSEQSNLSIRENVNAIVILSTNQKSVNNSYDTYSSETDSQSSKENYTRDESNANTKSCSKSLKNSQKAKSKISKKNADVNFSGTSGNSDDSLMKETQVQRVSSKITHRKESKPSKGTRIGNSKTKASLAYSKPISAEKRESNSGESYICSPIISPEPSIGKLKKTKEQVVTSNPITPIKRKSQRIKKSLNKSNISENEMDQTPKSKSAKKRTSTAKSPRTPSLSLHLNEELGLSWDKKCTPARRYSLRLKKANSESGTPRSSTNISHSSIGNTPTPSKRKQLLNTDLTNQLIIDSDSGSDSADCIPTNSKQSKQTSRKPAVATSTKRKLKKLDMNDSDFSGDSDISPAVISSRNSTPRRTPKKLSGKYSNKTDITNSTPKKTKQRKSTHK